MPAGKHPPVRGPLHQDSLPQQPHSGWADAEVSLHLAALWESSPHLLFERFAFSPVLIVVTSSLTQVTALQIQANAAASTLQPLHCFWRHRRKKLTAISRKSPHTCLYSECCHLSQPLIISNINCCVFPNSYLWFPNLYILKCISYNFLSPLPLAWGLFAQIPANVCVKPKYYSLCPPLTECHIVSNLSRQGTDLFEVCDVVTEKRQF